MDLFANCLNTLCKSWLLSFIFSPALLRGEIREEQAVIYQRPVKETMSLSSAQDELARVPSHCD
ncbi:MAG TPA: hypothetical protein VIW95_07375 [Candidatus Binatus sp.]|uniref:hypothetical protein n=1 Tax=Candidatus Binatus sp. TaxID=2811406 RepID=UPI002F42069C